MVSNEIVLSRSLNRPAVALLMSRAVNLLCAFPQHPELHQSQWPGLPLTFTSSESSYLFVEIWSCTVSTLHLLINHSCQETVIIALQKPALLFPAVLPPPGDISIAKGSQEDQGQWRRDFFGLSGKGLTICCFFLIRKSGADTHSMLPMVCQPVQSHQLSAGSWQSSLHSCFFLKYRATAFPHPPILSSPKSLYPATEAPQSWESDSPITWRLGDY